MNFLRRVYLLLLGLLLVIAVTLLLLSPQAVGSWVGSISELSPVVRLVITVVIDLFLLALMYLQVRPDPGAKTNGLVMRGSGAVTEVSVESARERILKAVGDVSDVISAEATVKPVRGRADIEMQVVVMGDDVRLPDKQRDINRALRQVIDKQLGLQIAGQPRIHLRIHGAEPSKPTVIASPVTPIIEKEPSPVVLPPKLESEPEPKPLSSFFGGRESIAETPVKADVEPKAIPDKPLPPPIEPEPEVPIKPRTGLFGGGWRSHDDVDEESDTQQKVEPLPTSEKPADAEVSFTSPPIGSPAASIPIIQPDNPDESVTKNQAVENMLNLDLDEELSHTDLDDFTDDESAIDEPDEASTPDKTADEAEPVDIKKPDEPSL